MRHVFVAKQVMQNWFISNYVNTGLSLQLLNVSISTMRLDAVTG